MKSSLEVLCLHAVKSLPDNLGERQAVLRALEKVLRANHPLCRDVRAQIAALGCVEKLNARLKSTEAGSQKLEARRGAAR